MKKIIFGTIFSVFALALFSVSAFASTETVYDATPNVVPQTSYPSLGFQATSTSGVGDRIHLGASNRVLNNVTVTMVTWARFSEYDTNSSYSGNNVSWTHPITINVYSNQLDSNGIPNDLLATKTQNITVPWRPEGDSSCPDTGYGAGFAWKNSTGACLNGLAFNATFDLRSLNVTLPNEIIVEVAYNTQSYGLTPMGVNGPFNSLNVAVPANQPVAVGADDNTDAIYWNSTYSGRTAGFYQDTGWTPYGTVALQVTASLATPISLDQCKKGGWSSFTSPTFKNQGQCVSYVQANVHAGKQTISF